MFKLISKPNLPQKSVKHCLIGKKYTDEIKELSALDIECIGLKPNYNLPLETDSHADILAFNCGNGTLIVDKNSDLRKSLEPLGFLVKTENSIFSPYPNDVPLNAALIENHLVCNKGFLSKEITAFANANGIKIINTKQGYSRCNICIVSEKAVITEDDGIADLLKKQQFDVLKISKGDVYLSDKHYGFLGGASGKVAHNKIYFSGDITMHKDYNSIIEFLNKHNVIPIFNKNRTLRDFGGFIVLTEG